MNKKQLIELFADAKFQTSKYDGDLSGRTYWEGSQAAYQKLLNRIYPGWSAQAGRGKDVWMCGASNYAILRLEAEKC